ncbi:hypothetical protein J5N97_011714 [Dioscorea zingiberensis]|uniref:Pentatricopeptide repeat-containing protein n=1 Tax=Dioscorea zingiberensis TaxID=325984 RepID=A0A9D5D2J1_9LILI|nr:hypothetical protein J5N97_011714 [Dioscorea zingiberensis]
MANQLRRLFSPSTTPASANPEQPQRVKALINHLFKIRDPDALVAAFNSASSAHPRFRAAHNIYSSAVRRLTAAGRPDSVRALLEHQKQFPDLRREGFALRLLSLYGTAKLPDDAVATFRQLPSLGCPRSVKSFNALLSACLDSKAFDLMADLFKQIPSEDPSISPSLLSYNILINALCEKPDLDAAFKTLDLIEANGFSPDLVSFNTLLNAFYSNDQVDNAEKVWSLMREKKIEPDTKSFNAKLRWLVSQGRVSEASEVVDSLRNNGPKPDAFSFQALIKGFCEDGKLEEAKRLFTELTESDFVPVHTTFQYLIPRLCDNDEIDLAFKICSESLTKKHFIDANTLQMLVNKLVEGSRMKEAKKLVELGRLNGCSRTNLRMP